MAKGFGPRTRSFPKGKSSNKAPPFMKTGASDNDADDNVAAKQKGVPSPKNMRKGK